MLLVDVILGSVKTVVIVCFFVGECRRLIGNVIRSNEGERNKLLQGKEGTNGWLIPKRAIVVLVFVFLCLVEKECSTRIVGMRFYDTMGESKTARDVLGVSLYVLLMDVGRMCRKETGIRRVRM